MEGAIKEYSKSIQLNKENEIAYSNRGAAKSNLGDYKGAIDDYGKALEINPNDSYSYFNRGISRSSIEDLKEQ